MIEYAGTDSHRHPRGDQSGQGLHAWTTPSGTDIWDVCVVLDLADTAVALRSLHDDEKDTAPIRTLAANSSFPSSTNQAVFPDPAESQAGGKEVQAVDPP